MLIQLLVIQPQNVCGGLDYHRLLVAAIDCVWCCVVGSVINEDEFIQKQGIFALLDLIDVWISSLFSLTLLIVLGQSEIVAKHRAWLRLGSEREQQVSAFHHGVARPTTAAPLHPSSLRTVARRRA